MMLSAASRTLGTLAFLQEDGLWVRELPGGKPARIATGASLESPRFSPSGRWITYFRNDGLHVTSRDGARDTGLGSPDRGTVSPGCQWLAGRDELMVSSDVGLQFFRAGSGWRTPVRAINRAGLPVVFSPHNQDIVYSSDVENGRGAGGEPMRTGQLCRLALEQPDGEPRVLVSSDQSGKVPCSWSRNGDYVLFWEDPDFSQSVAADGLELFRVRASGGPPDSLGVSSLVHRDMLSFAPAGDRLVIAAGGGREEWAGKRIAILHPETLAVSYLTGMETAAVCPAWSPHGESIAYSAAPNAGPGFPGGGEPARRLLAKRRIWIADALGRHPPKPLTHDERFRDERPMWSSDGTHILFGRIGDDDTRTLWLTTADGAEPVQVAGPLSAGSESWFGYYGYIAWDRMMDWWRGGS